MISCNLKHNSRFHTTRNIIPEFMQQKKAILAFPNFLKTVLLLLSWQRFEPVFLVIHFSYMFFFLFIDTLKIVLQLLNTVLKFVYY